MKDTAIDQTADIAMMAMPRLNKTAGAVTTPG